MSSMLIMYRFEKHDLLKWKKKNLPTCKFEFYVILEDDDIRILVHLISPCNLYVLTTDCNYELQL